MDGDQPPHQHEPVATNGDAQLLFTSPTQPTQPLPQLLPADTVPQAYPVVFPGTISADPASFLPATSLVMANAMATNGTVAPTPVSNAGGAAPLVNETNGISEDEIALYDRQIRLWGMKAQERIRKANILIITVRALGNEIAKNLVLAGIASLTVLDGDPVTEADLGAQFFLSEESNPIGKNRAEEAVPQIRKLNPRVLVHADAEGVKTKGASYFQPFDIVIATDLDPDTLNIINTATRLYGRAFYAAGSHGMFGFVFSDLIEHDYSIQRDAPNVATKLGPETRTRAIIGSHTKKEADRVVESVHKRELYSTWLLASDTAPLPEEYLKSKRRLRAVTPILSCLRALWAFNQANAGGSPSLLNRQDIEKFTRLATAKHAALNLPAETLKSEILRIFLQNIDCEMAAVAAILGGQLAQDVINVLGQTQQPIQNMVVLDGTTMDAPMYPLHPDGALGKAQLESDAAGMMDGGDLVVRMPGAQAVMGVDVDGTMAALV